MPAMAKGKGGHRNLKKPETDEQHVRDILDQQVRKLGVANCFCFSPYGEGITRSNACNAIGLTKAVEFITALANCAPSLTMKYGQLKDCFTSLAKKWTGLLERIPVEKQNTWPADTAEVVMILLAHTRRLADSNKFKECCSKATEWQIQQLDKLRKIALRAKEEEPEQEISKQQRNLEKEQPQLPEETSKKPRKVEKERPELDEMLAGLELPATPCSASEDLLEADADKASPIPPSKHEIKKQFGLVQKKPSGKVKGKGVATVKKRPSKGTAGDTGGTSGKAEITPDERQKLALMPYKTGACAIRVKRGRQLLQVKASSAEESKKLASKLKGMMEGDLTLKAALDLKAKWLEK